MLFLEKNLLLYLVITYEVRTFALAFRDERLSEKFFEKMFFCGSAARISGKRAAVFPRRREGRTRKEKINRMKSLILAQDER